MLDKSKIREIKQQDRTTTTTPLDLLKLSEKKNEEKINHEKQLLQTEQKYRNEVKNLTYNTIHDAIEKLDEVKQLIGDTRLQKPDITKMCAFRHKDGRILLGSIEHVTEAFNKSGHHITKADLEILEVGREKQDIKRISINKELITILKERGFKADIAKHGMNGELENVGTLHAKWDKDKGEMKVEFKKYEGNQSDRGSDAPSKENKQSPVELTLDELKKDKDDSKSPQDSSVEVVFPPVTTTNESDNSETFYDAPDHLAGTDATALTGKSETTDVTKPAVERQGIHKEIDDIMRDIKLKKLQKYWVERTMDEKNRQYLFDTCDSIEKKLNKVKDDAELKIIKKQLQWMKESLDEKIKKYPQQLVKENEQERTNFNQEISKAIKAFSDVLLPERAPISSEPDTLSSQQKA